MRHPFIVKIGRDLLFGQTLVTVDHDLLFVNVAGVLEIIDDLFLHFACHRF